MEQHPAEGTMAIHPDTLRDGNPAPVDGAPDTIPLELNEPERPNLRRFVDYDPHGLKNKGEGDLSKKTQFPDPKTEFQEYPKHIVRDGKTLHVASKDSEPVEVIAVDPDNKVAVEPQRIAIVDEPENSKLTTEPIVATDKSSGIDGDAGDWTTAGRRADGSPCEKGSPEDVS